MVCTVVFVVLLLPLLRSGLVVPESAPQAGPPSVAVIAAPPALTRCRIVGGSGSPPPVGVVATPSWTTLPGRLAVFVGCTAAPPASGKNAIRARLYWKLPMYSWSLPIQ